MGENKYNWEENKYCLKCKKRTSNVEVPTIRITRNKRILAVTRCSVCNGKKFYFVKQQKKTGKGLLNKAINSLPIELHIPGYQFCGPGTHLKKRLERGDQGINALDKACKKHDIAYSASSNLEHRNASDKVLSDAAQAVKENSATNWKEKLAASLVKRLMDAKVKWGMGSRKKKRKNDRDG